MKYSFKAKNNMTGINPCVDTPFSITGKMIAAKGYIPVKGKINGHSFKQTLVPVKNAEYRLHVNGPMLKGAEAKPGDTVKFIIEQDFVSRSIPLRKQKEFKKKLEEYNLVREFKRLTPYRQKEILRYMGFLKTKESLLRNIDKVIEMLKHPR
ncbi:MAG: hypothetical protein JWM28_3799 [Chitinophagaceae bacterium]|nr:hypothetical protein [Chitinophagaceae bacterium]